MKKISFLLIATFFVSCSNDDDNNSPTPEQGDILGKWYYKNVVVDGTTYPYDDHEPCGKDYIEFYDVNKVRAIDVWDCEEDLDWEANFVKTNNTLEFVENGVTKTVEIVELSATKLSYTHTTDLDEDGVEETIIENFDKE